MMPDILCHFDIFLFFLFFPLSLKREKDSINENTLGQCRERISLVVEARKTMGEVAGSSPVIPATLEI